MDDFDNLNWVPEEMLNMPMSELFKKYGALPRIDAHLKLMIKMLVIQKLQLEIKLLKEKTK